MKRASVNMGFGRKCCTEVAFSLRRSLDTGGTYREI
jgi:hypothetical protein